MGRSRELLFGLVLMVVSLGAALGAVEVGVRLLHLEPDRFWEYDSLVGSRLVPGSRGWWTQEEREFTVPISINSQGWRDVEHPVDKPAGVFRILLLGDSFTEAMQVPLETSYGRVLEAKLNESAPGKVEVINNGVSGFGTAGELLLFRQEGVRYKADLVLLAFYPGNDIMNNSPEIEDTLVPVYDAAGSVTQVKPGGGEPAKRRDSVGLLGHSKAYRYFRRQILTSHPDLAKRLAGWGLGPGGGTRQPRMVDGIPAAYFVYGPPDSAWEEAWGHTSRLVDDLKAETEKIGARLAVMIISSRDEVYPEKWHELLDTYPNMRGRTWDVNAPRQRIAALCRAKGIPVIELTPTMRAANEKDLLHFPADGHWTPAGHRLAGETIARALVEQGLVPRKGEGDYVTR